MGKYILFTLLNLVFSINLLFGQAVQGRIIDQEHEKGIAATLRAGNFDSASDSMGNFSLSLSLKPPFRLRITALGFRTIDTLIKSRDPLLFRLFPENKQLEEVLISTGYQKVKAEQLTGAVQQLGASRLQEQVGSTLLSRLEAIGSGLNIDRSTADGRITIRGLSSINGPKNVLIILDNFPYDGDLANINPNDVESVSILKDAAATSIWGSRAGNGVIVINTKKGKLNQPIELQASLTGSIVQQPDLYKLERMSSSDYIDMEQFLFQKGFYASAYNATAKTGLSPVVEILYDGSLSNAQKESQINQWRNLDVRDDFKNMVYKEGLNQQYFLQAKAGGKNYAWLASAGYDHNQDVLNALYRRMVLRYNLNFTLLKGLVANVSLQYSHQQTNSGKTGYTSLSALGGSIYPYGQLANADGSAAPLVQNYRLSYLNTLDTRLADWKYYPLTDYLHDYTKGDLTDINLNTGLQYKKGAFGFQFLYRIEKQTSLSDHLQDAQSYVARNMVNSFTQVVGNNLTYIVPQGGIRNANVNSLDANDLRFQMDYDQYFGDHHLTGFVAAERRSAISSATSNRFYGYNAGTLNFSAVDLVHTYPNYITGSYGFIPDGQGQSLFTNRFVSTVANVAYAYKETYFAYGSVRRDASNLFGVDINDKWKPLWSVGLGWLISTNGKWWDALDLLKLRASYGKSGNADASRTGLTTISYEGTSIYTQTPYAAIAQYYNPDLKWETVKTMNVGLDFKLWKGHLSGSVDYYRKRGLDLFGIYPVDYTGGTGPTVVRNIAAMTGTGLDFQIQSINISQRRFKWATTFNISTNHDQITDYYDNATIGNDYIGTGTITGLVGKPVYSVFSYRYGGLDAMGNPLGYLQGVASTDYSTLTGSGSTLSDLEYHGSATPTFFGNLQNNFQYGKLSIDIALSFKAGYYFRRNSIQYNNLVNSRVGHPDYALRWQKPGDEAFTQVPAFDYPINATRSLFYQNAALLVEKGDQIRLQYVNVAYVFTPKLFGNQMKEIRVFANCANIGLLWAANKKGIDPDYYNVLPPARTYSLGLKIQY